jgi:hypothetical protein
VSRRAQVIDDPDSSRTFVTAADAQEESPMQHVISVSTTRNRELPAKLGHAELQPF